MIKVGILGIVAWLIGWLAAGWLLGCLAAWLLVLAGPGGSWLVSWLPGAGPGWLPGGSWRVMASWRWSWRVLACFLAGFLAGLLTGFLAGFLVGFLAGRYLAG